VNVDAFGGDSLWIRPRPAIIHCTSPGSALMTLIVGMTDAALGDIDHGLDPSVWVLAENTARRPILHQRQERVRGCDPRASPPASVPDAMLRRHSLLNRRWVDPKEGSVNSSHGNSRLRSGAHHIRCEAVAVEFERRLGSSAEKSQLSFRAAVAARHVRNASSRKMRSVRRDLRWRGTLNVFWTAA
jgi:hypothetical protein